MHIVAAGLFYFISYFRKNINNKNIKNIGINYIYNKNSPYLKNKNKIKILILLLSLMHVLDDLLWIFIIISLNGIYKVLEERLFYLFFIPLFSKIILKENIYKHHYFSMLILLIGVIFIIIPKCLDLENDYIVVVVNILNFIKAINFSLFLIIFKYLIEKYYLYPLKISLIIGIISTIINTIGYVIYSLTRDDFSFFTDCFDFSGKNKLVISIYFIFYFVFGFLSSLFLFLSLFYFSPNIIIISNSITPLFIWIAMAIIMKPTTEVMILNPIGYLIILISSLIYNELIIFNCCGLNKNTKKFVNKRINKELEEIKNNEDNSSSESDDNFLIPHFNY